MLQPWQEWCTPRLQRAGRRGSHGFGTRGLVLLPLSGAALFHVALDEAATRAGHLSSSRTGARRVR